jgi:ABC-2 type transport system permease protein
MAMASNNEFQVVRNQGRLYGFANLFQNENRLWWLTSRWWVQILIWLAIANGILFLVIGVAPKMENPPGQEAKAAQAAAQSGATQQDLDLLGLTVFLKMAGIVIGIGVVVFAQDTLIGERQSGTIAWILSKPVTRSAFILAKVFSHSIGILLTMVITQGGFAYLIIYLVTRKAFPILPYMGALGMLFASLLFWLTLTIMLGALSNMRGLAIGIPLILLLGFTLFVEVAPWTANFMPWNLTSAINDTWPAMALSLVLEEPINTWMPLFTTMVGCLVFTLVAIWKFQKEEF